MPPVNGRRPDPNHLPWKLGRSVRAAAVEAPDCTHKWFVLAKLATTHKQFPEALGHADRAIGSAADPTEQLAASLCQLDALIARARETGSREDWELAKDACQATGVTFAPLWATDVIAAAQYLLRLDRAGQGLGEISLPLSRKVHEAAPNDLDFMIHLAQTYARQPTPQNTQDMQELLRRMHAQAYDAGILTIAQAKECPQAIPALDVQAWVARKHPTWSERQLLIATAYFLMNGQDIDDVAPEPAPPPSCARSRCSHCEAPRPKKRCGVCKQKYCSKACQAADWKVHQHVCGK